MQTGRTLTSVSTFKNFNIPYKKTIGHKLRDVIATCGHYLKPVKKYILPNFIAVHYAYIIFMTILCSILIYPCHNARYIDILFIACGAVTQGGLNTINVNELRLYQQMILYIICCLCTPIAIHGCLAFVRLYWFERYFDDIKDSSKRYFKMRRTRTILQREIARRRTLTSRTHSIQRSINSIPISSSKYGHSIHRANTAETNFQEKLFSGLKVNRDEESTSSDQASNVMGSQTSDSQSNDYGYLDVSKYGNSNNNSAHVNESGNDSSAISSLNSDSDDDSINNSHRKRVPLPQPGESFAKRRKSEDVKPEDMYRSIMMLREKQQQQKNDGISDDDEPVLFIKGRNINTSSLKKPVKRIQSDANSIRDSVESLKISTSMENSDVENYLNDKNEKSDLKHINNSGDSKDLQKSGIENINSYESENENMDNKYTGIKNGLDSDSGDTTNSTDMAVTDLSSESVLSNQSESRMSNQHITGINSADNDILEYRDDGVNALSGNKNREGQSIQFNITAPPRKMTKRKGYNSQYSKLVRPAYGKRRQLSRSSILRQLKKGGKLRKNIQRRMSNNNILGPFNELNPTDSKQSVKYLAVQTGNHDGEDYFADNETDEDMLLDVSPQKLNELSQAPDFQEMVYENWKANHKHNKRSENKRRKSWIFDNYYNDNHENAETSNMHGVSSPTYMKKHKSETHPDGSLSSDMETVRDVASSSQNESLKNYDYDEEDPAYYGMNSDYVSNTMNLPLSRTMSTNYLSWQPTVGRNSNFVGLTKEQRDELGGVEYRAIKLLCSIVVFYYVGFHVMAFTMFLPWICHMKNYIQVVRSDGISPAWWGFFTAMSSFNDLGITLTPNSMASFAPSIYVQVVMIWFMIIGNTGFPIMLRLIIWIMFHLAPDLSQTKESLGFLLDHPRRCFTLLFPSAATWWLLLALLFLNITDLILFIILDINAEVLKPYTKGIRVLMGAFQAVSTRTSGFTIVDLSQLHAAIQVSYMLMMYISVLPVAISIRRTNVYEERSLGLYGKMDQSDLEEEEEELKELSDASSNSEGESVSSKKNTKKNKVYKNNNVSADSLSSENLDKVSTKSFIGAHIRKQLSFDLWFLFLGLFIICICENDKIKNENMPDFNIFAILFEIVSAYGTVGLSLGYPNTDESFSAQFTTLSKLVIIAMLVRGRCRGLPYSLDRAIILPSERLERIDHIEDMKLRKNNTKSFNNVDPMTGYVMNTTGWIRNNLEKIGISPTIRFHKSETSPVLAEHEMGRGHDHQKEGQHHDVDEKINTF